MARQDGLELTEHELFWAHLYTSLEIVERAREIELSRLGLSVIQVKVLYSLSASHEALTPSKLGRLLSREPHSMSALVNRMEKNGLVTKKRDLKRKNLVRVSLTPKGKQALGRLRGARETARITTCLTGEEIESMTACADKLRARAVEIIRKIQPLPYDLY
jgi:DNA-binding MarR family transcriptional regulator